MIFCQVNFESCLILILHLQYLQNTSLSHIVLILISGELILLALSYCFWYFTVNASSFLRFIFGKIELYIALAGVAQWIEGQPANQRVAGSIPSQGTCLGCRPGWTPSWGWARGDHTLMFLSLSLSFPSPLSKSK